jgi:hypothetical protein
MKRMKTSAMRWVLIFVFLLTPTYGFGQQGLTIAEARRGYVFLELGMDEDIAISKLKSKGFSVSKNPGSDTYTITTKTKGDLHKSLGLISFTNKKLCYISRNWYESLNNMQAFVLGDKLYHLLEKQIGKKEKIKATITIKTSRVLEREMKMISITMENKKISLEITEGEKNNLGCQVVMREDISDKSFEY